MTKCHAEPFTYVILNEVKNLVFTQGKLREASFFKRFKFLSIKLAAFGSNFLYTRQMPVKNNPLAPFIKGDFHKSPLEKGDKGVVRLL